MRSLPCFHYMSPTFCGQNFYIISISPKTISTHLYCQHHLKFKKFCHERYFLMYFIDVCGGKNQLEKFWKYVIFFLEKFGKPHTIFCTNPVTWSWLILCSVIRYIVTFQGMNAIDMELPVACIFRVWLMIWWCSLLWSTHFDEVCSQCLTCFVSIISNLAPSPSQLLCSLLWPPYGIGQAIIFLPVVSFFSFLFYSLPNLSGRRLDVYHTSTHGVALVRI